MCFAAPPASRSTVRRALWTSDEATTATLAPSAARLDAMASPIPCEPPETNAMRLSNFIAPSPQKPSSVCAKELGGAHGNAVCGSPARSCATCCAPPRGGRRIDLAALAQHNAVDLLRALPCDPALFHIVAYLCGLTLERITVSAAAT